MPKIDGPWDYGYVRKDAKKRPTYIIRVSIGGRRYEVSTRRHTEEAAFKEYRKFEADPENYEPAAKAHLITPSEDATLDTRIRKLGNEANHELPQRTHVDAKDALEFVAQLLKLVHEFGARLKSAEKK